MSSLSLCMIVKNEEHTLARCLESIIDVIDEIVIVDTGSNDKTKEIATSLNATVYDFEWIDDFAAARNFSFSKAQKDYIIWLDADDVIHPQDLEKLRCLKEGLDGSISQVAALYNVGFDENGSITLSYYRERIFRNDKSFTWIGEVHECISFAPDVIYSDFAITHAKIQPTESGRNLKIYENIKLKRTLNPRELYYYARELFYNGLIQAAEEVFLSFLQSNGWVINKIDACMMLSKCRLKENDIIGAKKALFNSFLYGEPTAEICCEIGRLFMEEANYNQSVFWYSMALTRIPDMKNGGFINPDTHTYVPCMQLCVCYDRLGKHDISSQYNEYASTFKPHSKEVEFNRNYFKGLFHGDKTD